MIAGKLLEKSDEESLGGRLGYNAATDVFEDLVAVGVIDPVKVRVLSPSCYDLVHITRPVSEACDAPPETSSWCVDAKACPMARQSSRALLMT